MTNIYTWENSKNLLVTFFDKSHIWNAYDHYDHK